RAIGCSGGGAANAPAANSKAPGNRARVKRFLFMAYSLHSWTLRSLQYSGRDPRKDAIERPTSPGAKLGSSLLVLPRCTRFRPVRNYSPQRQCTLNPAMKAAFATSILFVICVLATSTTGCIPPRVHGARGGHVRAFCHERS